MRAVCMVVAQSTVDFIFMFRARRSSIVVKKTQRILTCILVQAIPANNCDRLTVLVWKPYNWRWWRIHFFRGRLLRLMNSSIYYWPIIRYRVLLWQLRYLTLNRRNFFLGIRLSYLWRLRIMFLSNKLVLEFSQLSMNSLIFSFFIILFAHFTLHFFIFLLLHLRPQIFFPLFSLPFSRLHICIIIAKQVSFKYFWWLLIII